jgi:hypothetical protein
MIKLQKAQNPQIKELMVHEQDQDEANKDFTQKLSEETDKTNKLLDELIQLKENLSLKHARNDQVKMDVEV